MKPNLLRAVLAISLLINIGVIGAIAYRTLGSSQFPGLPRHLQLSEEQAHHWHASEAAFLAQLRSNAAAIRSHRDRLIHEIFADTPDLALIDAERTAIASLQDDQQKRVIQQLLQERELLTAAQRARLAQLLLNQPAGASSIEQLHRD
ncbi:MAG: periplasmic heavy metal sensor [Sulfuritalea sp.]|nr:periplasmic heavy metal sensor [Sulfuritalea sp.]